MLVYKAWLESHFRFLVGLIAVTAVSILFMKLRPILVPGWIVAFGDPKLTGKPPWLAEGIRSVNFYAWHFLWENKLQQVWVLFAILLSLGGLTRERGNGYSAFSLSLPVTRRRWLMTTASVTIAQLVVLAMVAAVVTWLASLTNHESYSLTQALAHGLLIAGAGLVFVGATLVLSAIVRSDLTAVVAALAVFGVPYLFVQEYEREISARTWVAAFDVSHVMSGPPTLLWSTTPWLGLGLCVAVFAALFLLAVRLTERAEF